MVRKFFPIEQELARWGLLTLTTHRVIHSNGSATMLIHKVSGTRIAHYVQPVYIVLAVAVSLSGIVLRDSVRFESGAVGAILAAVFVGVYFSTRHTIVEIHGDGQRLTCAVRGVQEREMARRFIDGVERLACIACRGPEPVPVEPVGVRES